jgi:small acid-soluble spore protein I (minor)
MDIDIRKHVISNLKGTNEEEINDTITESINEKDEATLPGLGVLFELLWNKASENMKDEILKILEKEINKESI